MESPMNIGPVPSFLIIATLLPIALGVFLYSMIQWWETIRVGSSPKENRLTNPTERLKGVLTYVVFQKRLFQYPLAGLMHAIIFWGFCLLTLRAASLIFAAFSFSLYHALMSTSLGRAYLFLKDFVAALVLLTVSFALFRRLFFRPKRLHHSLDALFILFLILMIMVTDFAMEGAYFCLYPKDTLLRAAQPISAWVSQWMQGLSPSLLEGIMKTSFWLHIGIILFFLNYLPYSKHFHVITSVPNVYLRPLKPMGKIETLDLEDEEKERFGTGWVSELSWKNLLDVYTCTECGRCHDHCPAWQTGKPLSPMKVNIALRHHLEKNKKNFQALAKGEASPESEWNQLLEVIQPEVFWACTTCGYCEEACPLWIEDFQRFIGMRQYKVLMEGDFPEEAQTALMGMENQGNPWGLSPKDREKWMEGLSVPKAEPGQVELLFWVGCAGAYDKRGQKVARSIVKILQAANISFAVLGNKERCTGDPARRLGQEYLFQLLAKENIETLEHYQVKRILTMCPHCLNTFQNEYPDFGGHYQVLHHTQLIAELLEQGKLRLKGKSQEVIYHDPCYLGRHNGIYDAPRKALEHSVEKLHEFKLNRKKSFCCGGGGGHMWMEDKTGERINQKRLKQAKEAAPSVQTVAVGCPFCMTMLEDASTALKESYKIKDIAEIIAEQI